MACAPRKPLREFGISSRNGFLPVLPPLERLPHLYYQPWELIIADLPALLKSQKLRSRIDSLLVLSISHLCSEREQQRAYMLLSFMAHGYIWGGNTASEIMPPPVAIPFLALADIFGLPTTATYAGLNLWNFAPISPNVSLCDPDNLRSLCTFTGTRDEEWFYLISVAMEARGGSIIPNMMRAVDAVVADDPAVITSVLLNLAETLKMLGDLLDRMYEHCDPYIFYYQIRPFLAGSKNMSVAGLPQGVFYDEGEGKGQWRMYSGGSNAQSSLIQFFDVILGIQHKSTGESGSKSSVNSNAFLQEMRRYMPQSHADFLAYVPTLPSLRSYVFSHPLQHNLTEAFNSAITRLGEFRDRHIQIVTRYIIIPSRTKSKAQEVGAVINLASASMIANQDRVNIDGPELHGTGGTQLIPFLRQTRDETNEAIRTT